MVGHSGQLLLFSAEATYHMVCYMCVVVGFRIYIVLKPIFPYCLVKFMLLLLRNFWHPYKQLILPPPQPLCSSLSIFSAEIHDSSIHESSRFLYATSVSYSLNIFHCPFSKGPCIAFPYRHVSNLLYPFAGSSCWRQNVLPIVWPRHRVRVQGQVSCSFRFNFSRQCSCHSVWIFPFFSTLNWPVAVHWLCIDEYWYVVIEICCVCSDCWTSEMMYFLRHMCSAVLLCMYSFIFDPLTYSCWAMWAQKASASVK